MVVAQLSTPNYQHKFDTAGTPRRRAVRELLTPPVANGLGVRPCTDAKWKSFESATLRNHYAVIVANRLQVKIREPSQVRTLSLNLALGIRFDGTKEILAIDPTPAFVDRLHERGVESILFALFETTDGVCGAFEARYPRSCMQASISQLVRQSLGCVTPADRSSVAAALRGIYRETYLVSALSKLELFAVGKWGRRYPGVAELWRRRWERIAGHFELPIALRRFFETADAVVAVQEKLQRQAVSLTTSFKSEDAAVETLSALVRNCAGGWRVAPRRWMILTAQCAALREQPLLSD